MDIFFIFKRYNSAVHLKPSPSTSLLTTNQVEKPATIGTATGILFQSGLFSSFHCLVTDVKNSYCGVQNSHTSSGSISISFGQHNVPHSTRT